MCLPLLLAGCSITQTEPPTAEPGVAIRGIVHGGNLPIEGSNVYVLSSSAAGFGSPSLGLLTSVPGSTMLDTSGGPTNGDYYVTTDSSGGFSITGDYTCIPGRQVYLYAWGGNPGLAPGTNNSAIGMMTVLGPCPMSGNFLGQYPFVVINEVTTVPAAFALGGYAFDSTHIASSGSAPALVGVANAFLNAGLFVDISTGQARATTPAGNAVVPVAEINAMANFISDCINSTGPSSTGCSSLFADAGFLGDSIRGHNPTDTATALINIVHQPGVLTEQLFDLVPADAPFQPSLIVAPSDWTLSLTFTGAGLSNPFDIVTDAEGDFWGTNSSANSLSELSPQGAPISGSGGIIPGTLTNPDDAVFGLNGKGAVTNSGSSEISLISNTGASLGAFTYPAVSLPAAVVAGPGNTFWLPDYDDGSITVIDSSGNLVSPSGGYFGGGIAEPVAGLFDVNLHFWTQNYFDQTASEFNGSGGPISPPGGYPLPGSNFVTAMASDHLGNIYFLNGGTETMSGGLAPNTGAIFAMNNSGTVTSPTGGVTSCGPLPLGYPYGLAVDGDGVLFVANTGKNTIGSCSVNFYGGSIAPPSFSTAGSTGTALKTPYNLTIDASGNIGVANYTGNSITVFYGIAAPVAPTPFWLESTSLFDYRL